MLLGELPELEETQSGKDLIRIGEQRGEKRGEKRGEERGLLRGADQELTSVILTITKTRFGELPKPWQSRVSSLSRETRERLLEFAVTCGSLAEIKDWLKKHSE